MSDNKKTDITDFLEEFVKSMELNELTPDFELEKVNSYVYKFNINGLEYRYEAEESIEPISNTRIIEIKFRLLNNPKQPDRKNYNSDIQYNIDVRQSQIGLSETGNSIKVFKKVLGATVKVIKETTPNYISFTADGESRQSLYERLIEMMKKYISNYSKTDINPITQEPYGNEEFWLKRNDN